MLTLLQWTVEYKTLAITTGTTEYNLPSDTVDVINANIKIEIMDLLFEIQNELDIGILLISHDLGSVKHYCKRVAVMRSGD